MSVIPPAEAERSTRQLIVAADQFAAQGDNAGFVRAYRAWINAHHVVPGDSRDERQDKVRLLLLAMLNGRDLGGALDIMLRFARHSIGELSPVQLADHGGFVRIVMNRTHRLGAAGLIGELWALAFHRSQLEFLAGRVLPGIHGTVRHDALLSPHVEACLFWHQVEHRAEKLALCLPKGDLTLPIVVNADQVSDFVHSLMPSGTGTSSQSTNYASLVETILRMETLRLSGAAPGQPEIAWRIGCSVATLRRRLADQDTSFRTIQTKVRDEIARHWLRESRLPIAVVAERLGYGDGYSFRRAFLRMNGQSPAAFRRNKGADPGG